MCRAVRLARQQNDWSSRIGLCLTDEPSVSNCSRTAVANRDLVPVDDHRHGSLTAAYGDHLVHTRWIGLDVDVFDVAPGIGLTGLGGIGSPSFSIDLHDICHGLNRIR